MGKAYAGTLGPLAFATMIVRGLVHGGGIESTILAAVGGLFLFALIGYIAGQLADLFVRDSVRSQFQAALAAYERAAAERRDHASRTR
jgi:uncharacterized membrane protein